VTFDASEQKNMKLFSFSIHFFLFFEKLKCITSKTQTDLNN
jgi:hypothetical protein